MEVYGVFVVQKGFEYFNRVHIPLALFSTRELAERYQKIRKIDFPQELTVVEVWQLDSD